MRQALELGCPALALTDHNGLYGSEDPTLPVPDSPPRPELHTMSDVE